MILPNPPETTPTPEPTINDVKTLLECLSNPTFVAKLAAHGREIDWNAVFKVMSSFLMPSVPQPTSLWVTVQPPKPWTEWRTQWNPTPYEGNVERAVTIDQPHAVSQADGDGLSHTD
jgi:hypothetical protein